MSVKVSEKSDMKCTSEIEKVGKKKNENLTYIVYIPIEARTDGRTGGRANRQRDTFKSNHK